MKDITLSHEMARFVLERMDHGQRDFPTIVEELVQSVEGRTMGPRSSYSADSDMSQTPVFSTPAPTSSMKDGGGAFSTPSKCSFHVPHSTKNLWPSSRPFFFSQCVVSFDGNANESVSPPPSCSFFKSYTRCSAQRHGRKNKGELFAVPRHV